MPEYPLGRFGDRRLAATGEALLEAMQKQRTMCLHALADNREQQRRFNDFLDNEAVTRHEMLVHAGRLTARRAGGRNVVVVSDTSEHNYARHSGRKRGFGTVGNGADIGVLIHPLVALDAETGGVIGLVGAEVINRPPGKAADHKTRQADHKESRRWLAGLETAGDVLAEAAMITMVEDREGGHLRPIRPPAGQRAPADPCRPEPLPAGRGETVRDLHRLVGGRTLHHHRAGQGRRGQEPARRAPRGGGGSLRRGDNAPAPLGQRSAAATPDRAGGGCA
jgi:hypothetical protein